MTLRLEVVGSVAVVTLAGECDMSEAPRLAAALRQAGERAGVVQVDLSDLDFLDSSGLHVLYRASSELAAMRSRLVLVSPTDAIRRVLQIAGLEDHFEIRESLEDLALPDDGKPSPQAGAPNGNGPRGSLPPTLGEGATTLTAVDITRRQAV